MSKLSKSRTTASQGDSQKGTAVAQSLFSQAAFTTFLHPITYGKTLIQLGHEPLKPIKRHTLASLFRLGTKKYAYPSIFAICGNIKNQDGWIALWTTGLAANILQVTVQSQVYGYTLTNVKSLEGDGESKSKDTYAAEFFKEVGSMLIARSVSDIVSQPFFVIMVRQMASFADEGKRVYTTFPATTQLIWREEGLKGFFAGLLPRLLGDAVAIVLTQVLARAFTFLLDKLAAYERGGMEPGAEQKTVLPLSTTASLAGLISSSFSYPYSVVSTVMCINNTRVKLAGAVAYSSWKQCLNELSRTGEAKRGISLFLRYLTDHQLKRAALTN